MVPVAIALQRLFCYHGADEGRSEPYLWVIGFTIDGRTITHEENSSSLAGLPSYFFSPGSHGSIGGDIGIGANRIIPPNVGYFATTLQPILLKANGESFNVPGMIGLIGILLEEDMTSDEGAEAAHQAINNMVQIEINEAVEDIDLAGLGAQILEAVNAGATPENAVQAIFARRINRLITRIQRYARAVAVDAIVTNLSFPAAIVEASDPDDFMGVIVQFFNEEDLEHTSHSGRIEFTETIAEPGVAFLESSDYVYNIHGEAWRRGTRTSTPITDQVPPGRWRITGINRSGRPYKRYISHVGGSFADGSPWLLSKGKVMDFLAAGTHAFFVRGESGLEADVIIQPDPVSQYFPSITTQADSDPTNNLGALPQCPLAIDGFEPYW